MSSNPDYIRIRKEGEEGSVGTFTLIYGNDGWDVIADNTSNLEDALQSASELADELEIRYA